MPVKSYTFPDVSLLITHYNRSQSLERLLNSFRNLGCTFGSIVVSDDGSKPEHQKKLQELKEEFSLRLVLTEKNKGLGNNINKGQDACNTPYTLYVQEDFDPTSAFPEKFTTAVALLNERKDVEVVRFYAYFKYPYLKPLRDGFSEMKFNWWAPGYKKFYYYSDHPHMRRSSFFTKFGRYPEGQKVERTEYLMMMSFLKNKGKALFYDDYEALFEQKNSSLEPSTVKRNVWRESENIFIFLARHFYRHLRFNYDYLFSK